MSFKLPFGVEVLNPVPTDTRRGPYSAANETDAKALACAGVPSGVRGQGQQVDLIIAGQSLVYVWANGTGDTDLVPLETPLPQGLATTDSPTFEGLNITGPNGLVVTKDNATSDPAVHPVLSNVPYFTIIYPFMLDIVNLASRVKRFIFRSSSLPNTASTDVTYVYDLPENSGTLALTSDIPALPFRGHFATLTALQTAIPTANAGDYALITGSPTDTEYFWDSDNTTWVERGTSTGAPSFSAITGNATDNASLNAALGGKVDKITGKNLSTNDYTTIEQTKLASLPTLPTLGTRGTVAIWTVVGDSRTSLDGPGSTTYRKWFEIVCELYGVMADNRAVQGMTLQNGSAGTQINDGSNSYQGNLVKTPIKAINNEKLFIDLATNDLSSSPSIYTTTAYTSAYIDILNDAVSKGWVSSDIVLISAGYLYEGGAPTLTRQQAYRDALLSIGTTFGCQVIDYLTFMQAAYSYNGQIYTLDGIHENNSGYDQKARFIAPVITGINIENRGQSLAVNGLIEAKQLRITGNGNPFVPGVSLAKYGIVGADTDGQLKILPFTEVVRNVSPTDTPQAISINISGNAKVADLFMNYTGGAPTGVIRQYGTDRFLFMKPDFSDYLDIYVKNLFVSGSPNFLGRVNIGASAWFSYGTQLIAVDASTGSTYRDITGQNYLAFGTLTVGGSATLSGGIYIGQNQNSNLPILMQSIAVSSDSGSGALGGAFRIYSNNNMSVGKNNYSLNIRSYDVSSGESGDLFKFDGVGALTSTQYKLSALNTAPTSSSDTGTTGEIRITSTYIYVCVAANSWVRSALSTW